MIDENYVNQGTVRVSFSPLLTWYLISIIYFWTPLLYIKQGPTVFSSDFSPLCLTEQLG